MHPAIDYDGIMRSLPPKRQYPERPPWTQNFDTVKTRMVDAAWNALLRRDLTQISFRELANEVGVTPAALYHHFESIEALGAELSTASGARLRAEMGDMTRRHGNPRACFKAYLRFAARRPHHLTLVLAPQHRHAEHTKWSHDCFLKDFEVLLQRDSGRRSVTPSEVRALWMILHGAAVMIAGGVATEREAFDDIKPLLDRLTGRAARPARTVPKRASKAGSARRRRP